MNIEEVLQIKEQMLGDYSVQAVDGRALHEALGVKREFNKWIKERLLDAGAALGTDYTFAKNGEAQTARIDYTLTLSTAKDIAMLTRGDCAKSVRDYFKACEKTVQTQVQQLIASNEELDIEINRQLNRIKMIVGEVSNGVKIATALECQEKYAQRTGISIDLPEYIKKYIVDSENIEFDPEADTAFASRVAIGSNSTNVSQWAKQYKHINSTRINDVLVKRGYARRLNKSQITPTEIGREFCHTAIAASGFNVGKELIKGWKLDDKRFTDDVFPILNDLEDYLHQQWIINKKKDI